MAIRILPWDKLDNISKQKFNNEAEYLAFFRNTVLPDTASKEKYISQIKEKVSEGVVWAKEFAKFHQRYKDGFPFKFDEKNTKLCLELFKLNNFTGLIIFLSIFTITL